MTRPNERGAALVTALLIVAVMAATSIVLIESLRHSMRLSSNLADREQARLYALGAEELAAATIRSLRAGGLERYPALDQQVRRPVVFPIDGGTIEARLSDGANCFNLNSLVEPGEDNSTVASSAQLELYRALLVELGLTDGEAESLSIATADWIDSDDRAGFGGAEDPYYVGLRPGYRTPGQFMADVSELHLLRGYTPALIEALQPLVCTRWTYEPSPLNINTLDTQHLPLLATYLGPQFDTLDAAQILSERPAGGFDTVEEMFALPLLARFQFIDGENARFDVVSDVYDVFVRVDYRQSVVGLNAILSLSDTGEVVTQARRYGAAQ